MMKQLDLLFQKSKTQKYIAVSSNSWNRVNDLLTADKKKNKVLKMFRFSIAASIIILVGIGFFFQKNEEPDYQIEKLDITEIDMLYSSRDIAILNQTFLSTVPRAFKTFGVQTTIFDESNE